MEISTMDKSWSRKNASKAHISYLLNNISTGLKPNVTSIVQPREQNNALQTSEKSIYKLSVSKLPIKYALSRTNMMFSKETIQNSFNMQ